MATCRDIITRAMRQIGVLSIGRDPKATEADYGLTALQSMYDGWVMAGMFGRLTDVYVTEDYDAKEGERVVAIGATVTLPTFVDDDGDRPVRQFACIVTITDGVKASNIHFEGAWASIEGLTLDSAAPLAGLSVEGLAGCLAEQIASPFGVEPPSAALRAANQFRRSLSYKLGSSQDAAATDYF